MYEEYELQTTESDREISLLHMYDDIQTDNECNVQDEPTNTYTFQGVEYD